jgi:hypothetical protein
LTGERHSRRALAAERMMIIMTSSYLSFADDVRVSGCIERLLFEFIQPAIGACIVRNCLVVNRIAVSRCVSQICCPQEFSIAARDK